MPFIRTMLGDIKPEQLGFTYSHEHIVCRPRYWIEHNQDDLLLDDPEKSCREVELFRQAGGVSIVDATAIDYGRDPAAVRDISKATGVQIIGTAGFNKSVSLLSEEKSKKALGEFLRPEFLNRVDEIITFAPLPRELFGSIVRIFLSDLADGLREREIAFECTDAAVEKLADMSYSSEYGARNVRRVVQREIEDKVVSDMCDADVKDGELTVVAE